MFASVTLRGRTFAPPLFGAPMAGLTHSAFRRLVADFGGYGALFTEMLCAPALLQETFANSAYVRRRPEEGAVFYQLLVGSTDRLEAILDRLCSFEPAGVDVNLACHARDERRMGGGAALFRDMDRTARILDIIRRRYSGPLSVKIRLGWDHEGWQERLAERGRLFRTCGVDAIILHPRFLGEKFRRHARYQYVPWAVQTLGLPLILSGDLTGPDCYAARHASPWGVAGLMIGRMTAVQPWIFARWSGRMPAMNHAEVWFRFLRYVTEDFPEDRRLSRIKIFTEYFARNFRFGHMLFAAVQSARTLDAAQQRAEAFFTRNPEILAEPSVLGIS